MEYYYSGRVVHRGAWANWDNPAFNNFYSESECCMVRSVWCCQWLINGEVRRTCKNLTLGEFKQTPPSAKRSMIDEYIILISKADCSKGRPLDFLKDKLEIDGYWKKVGLA
jgi:hypothetical protein